MVRVWGVDAAWVMAANCLPCPLRKPCPALSQNLPRARMQAPPNSPFSCFFSMTDWLPSDFSLPALLPRTLGTAAVVVGAGWAAMRLGPLAGGLLAGLPLVMGPGFFFLLRQTPAAVVAQMASHTLLALCAVPVYLLAYMAALRHWPPWRALLGAVPAWVGAAWLLHAGAAYLALDQGPGRALVLFALLTAAAGVWGVRLRLPRRREIGRASCRERV